MPRLLLLCIQIICFCLAWALITFQIQPFSGVWNFISGSVSPSHSPQWAVHTNYLFAIILIVTGISATVRLKILTHFTSVSITFLTVLWICFAFQPELYFTNLLKYSYIVLIPFVFHQIFTQNIRHIEKIIKATIQISLIYIPYHIGLFIFNETNLSSMPAVILTSTFTLIAVGASLGLYMKRFLHYALQIAVLVFTLGFSVDILPLINLKEFDFNQIPMAVLSSSLILFTRWVQALSIGD